MLLKRTVLLVSIVIISLVILACLSFSFIYYGGIASNFKIYNNASNISSYPYINFWDITNGKLNKFLINEEFNKTFGYESEYVTINYIGDVNPITYKDIGINYMQLAGSDLTENRYDDINKRPFRLVAFFKTRLGLSKYLVLVERWQNNDGTVAFLPFLLPQKMGEAKNHPSDFYSLILDPNANNFISPIMEISDITKCKTVLRENDSYCNWYFNKAKVRSGLKQIMQTVKETFNFPNEVGNYPLLIKMTKVAYD